MISRNRLAVEFQQMAQFSTTIMEEEGITRLAFSDSDWSAREYVRSLMVEAGLEVRSDAFGNIVGRRGGSEAGLPAIMVGSHIDSVPNGGNYDGVLGVLSAIEVARSLEEEQVELEHPLEIVVFMCEESSRFGTATLGSRAMCGELSLEEIEGLKDKAGTTLAEVLQARGLEPARIGEAKYQQSLKAFIEVHIEQGRVLEHNKIPVGIVTGIAAPTRMRIYLAGSADHSGATPMDLRKDALCAAAEIILAVESCARAQIEPPVVGTVGIIEAKPGVMNVIPGNVELGIDIRSISGEAKAAVVAAVKMEVARICQERGVAYQVKPISDEVPAVIALNMQELLETTCEELGVASMRMPSGAGHDAMHWAEHTPTGMLFIPCRDGISHNAAEHAELEDIYQVTVILEQVVKKLGKQAYQL